MCSSTIGVRPAAHSYMIFLYSFILFNHLFAIAICCNYSFNLFHKGIIVILIVNSSKHWVTYNITISIN